MTTIEKILELMRKNNINANLLAKELGFGNSQFTSWKNGIAKPSTEALLKLANYFNVSVDYLLGREKPEFPDIRVANEKYNQIAWYMEKTNNLLLELSNIVDDFNQYKNTLSKEYSDTFLKRFDTILFTAFKLFATTAGLKDYELNDYEIILKKGYDGYLYILEKYNITQQDINKLFTRD